MVVQSGGVSTYALTSAVTTVARRVKMVYTSDNELSFYYWNTNVWTQIGVTQTVNLGVSGKVRLVSNSNGSDAAGDKFSFDELKVTNEDYATETPA